MAKMGFNCFRMSINWSRIYPNGNDEIANEERLKNTLEVLKLPNIYFDLVALTLINY